MEINKIWIYSVNIMKIVRLWNRFFLFIVSTSLKNNKYAIEYWLCNNSNIHHIHHDIIHIHLHPPTMPSNRLFGRLAGSLVWELLFWWTEKRMRILWRYWLDGGKKAKIWWKHKDYRSKTYWMKGQQIH